jgi:hypothetical protein
VHTRIEVRKQLLFRYFRSGASRSPTGDLLLAKWAPVNGWRIATENIGNYGTDYLQRACVELIGLGANLPEDAIYPIVYVDADGNPFTGSSRYVWHLAKDELPPVHAFWSLTLYDAEGFQVANDLNRFAIGDRDDLRFNDDGSVDIAIQHDACTEGTSNWLPAPADGFNLCAPLYYPKPEVLDGTWTPPAVTKVYDSLPVAAGA